MKRGVWSEQLRVDDWDEQDEYRPPATLEREVESTPPPEAEPESAASPAAPEKIPLRTIIARTPLWLWLVGIFGVGIPCALFAIIMVLIATR
jgi:hypothetical protein